MPERSFFIKGKQFPICARCTGMLIGFFVGILYIALLSCPSWAAAFLIMLPLIVDGTLQQFTAYNSGNIRRLITGLLFGVAMIFLLVNWHFAMVALARRFLDWRGIPHR